MKDTILAQVMGLKGLSTEELLKKYEELFGGKKAPSAGYIVGNYGKFLFSAPVFDFGFAFEGLGFCGAFFGIDKGNGRANSCIGATSSLIVSFYAAGEIIGYASIEGIIGAFNDVDVPHGDRWPLRS